MHQGNVEEHRPQHAKNWSFLVEEEMAETSYTLAGYQKCHLVKFGRKISKAYSLKLLTMTAFVALSLFLGPIAIVPILLDLVPVSFLGLRKSAHFQSAISGYLMAGHRCDEVYVRRIVLTKFLFERDTLRSSLFERTSLSRRAYIINFARSSLYSLAGGRYMRIIFKDSVREGCITSKLNQTQ